MGDHAADRPGNEANLHGGRALGSACGFVEADVMSVAPPVVPAADIISVLNFSVLYLHDAAQLQTYLRHAWHCLASPGRWC
jgi:hypothetical protein